MGTKLGGDIGSLVLQSIDEPATYLANIPIVWRKMNRFSDPAESDESLINFQRKQAGKNNKNNRKQRAESVVNL